MLAAAAGCLTVPGPPETGPVPTAGEVSGAPPAEGAARNPFAGARFYVDPEYVAKVDGTLAKVPGKAPLLRKVQAFPTALWLDSIAKVASVPAWLDDALKQQTAAGQPVVPVFVVYDLPNRDCSAKASNGELSIEANGEERYRTEFIDRIAAHFASHASQRIVAIIEPDSLPNLATNMAVPKCRASADAYRRGVAYAISKLSLPHVSLYLDAAHAGWLGWHGNRTNIARIFRNVLAAAGGAGRIRGFATNVANYNSLKGGDGRKLEPTNPTPDELSYVASLTDSLESVGITDKGFIIDTSRNGRSHLRTRWGSWCNVRGAGLGERPRVAPRDNIDAFFWVKPPGDSDGTADATAARFDANCRSADATPGAPEAGQWFDAYFLQLVENANPPL